MVVLPDGIAFEMQWKKVKYIKKNNFMTFQIVPMIKDADIVILPTKKNWKTIENTFSQDERWEIIFLLERIKWKRDIKVREVDIMPYVNKDIDIMQGTIESTTGYKALSNENLFDVHSQLNKMQVREIYLKLEERFAMAAQGIVTIPKETLIIGSVQKEYVIPILKKNPNVNLRVI